MVKLHYPEGFKALNVIADEGIETYFTVVYTTNQALPVAKLGAKYDLLTSLKTRMKIKIIQ